MIFEDSIRIFMTNYELSKIKNEKCWWFSVNYSVY